MHQKGLSLINLIIALSIAAALMLAIDPMLQFLERTQLESAAQDLVASIRFARSKAILTQTRITVRAMSDDWSNGWAVFSDENRNGIIDDGEVIHLLRPQSRRSNILGNRPVATYIHYSAAGTPELLQGGFQAGSLLICSKQGSAPPIKAVLSREGRIRLEKLDSRDCAFSRAPSAATPSASRTSHSPADHPARPQPRRPRRAAARSHPAPALPAQRRRR